MNITSDMAEILLRQFLARSELLAPLGSIAETCWLIMLRLYTSSEEDNSAEADLANAMHMTVERVSRYLAVLFDAGFVELDEASGGYSLTDDTRMAVDEIMRQMVQDILSSLER